MQGTCANRNAIWNDDFRGCVTLEEVAPVLECPPGHTVSWHKDQLCKDRARLKPIYVCDPPFTLDSRMCERRVIRKGFLGCQPVSVQTNALDAYDADRGTTKWNVCDSYSL
eukprot:Gregarina_sp_Poly_1__4294@NODE_2334_length_2280_cov_11_353818_g1491_i0_p3_GENE_NODE_2334_length_2280_cov_11_353818_g1491_i0NODE_2334_length_2280_cov_11_353818_g1491_i0_p3_ORF_typecomplete_len111_score0_58_NODE_2334_length_2280_cov_11_353818_g1491_i010581390